MSTRTGGRKLKHVIASLTATIFIGGAVAVPTIVSHVGSPAVASGAIGPAASPGENNWG
jgi:hypothetical protein